MSKSKSTGTAQAAQSSTHPNDAVGGDPINDQMVANVLVIWLDPNIHENNSDYRNTVSHLRHEVHTINIFADAEDCIDFLGNVENEKACMIISSSLGQQIVPLVHNMSQVHSICIFPDNKKDDKGWTKHWSKIKGVFTEIESICDILKEVTKQCEQTAISISIIGDNDGGIEKSGNRLDPSFMYTQIMKEVLLTINFEQKHIAEFIQYCRKLLKDNGKQLECVNEFARDYRQHTPIWWYTRNCFLYPMLNRALRTMNADLMIKLGFFIGDLHRHIGQLHQAQFGNDSSRQHFTVYRGQGMDKKAFNKMQANKDGLLSFNSFLSTSKNLSISHAFAMTALADAQLTGVLFVMHIDPTQSSTSFASVDDVSYFRNEENEVLFSMHTVFRIGEITSMGGDARLAQVHLNLVSDKHNDLYQLIDYVRMETFPNCSGWDRLGAVLWKMGESAKALQVYEIQLDQETKDSAKAPLYNQMGVMKQEQGAYAEAILYYEKSIKIEERQIPRNDLSLASSYNNIGSVYNSMGDYPKALSSYEKALTIQLQSLPSTHPHVAGSYNNIGSVYNRMGDYPKALSFYEKALAIRLQSLPPTHPDLAGSYGNMGLLYENMGSYSKAHSYFSLAMDMAERSLPVNHPSIQKHRNNIARIKRKL